MTTPAPEWFQILSWVYVIGAIVCAAIITIDEIGNRQRMMIMNLVWPITALYWGPIGLWAYFTKGRRMSEQDRRVQMKMAARSNRENQTKAKEQPPTPAQVALADSHCGSGCTLGDILSEWTVWAVALTFVGGLVFPTRLVLDFILAWSLGILFQYFTIVPMRGLYPCAAFSKQFAPTRYRLLPSKSDCSAGWR